GGTTKRMVVAHFVCYRAASPRPHLRQELLDRLAPGANVLEADGLHGDGGRDLVGLLDEGLVAGLLALLLERDHEPIAHVELYFGAEFLDLQAAAEGLDGLVVPLEVEERLAKVEQRGGAVLGVALGLLEHLDGLVELGHREVSFS